MIETGLNVEKWAEVALANGLTLLYAVVIFVVGMWLAKRLSKMLVKVLRLRKVDETIVKFVSRLVYYVLMLFVVLAVLSKLSVPTTSLVAILGGMSIAVGLSLRSSLSNLASGFLLILFRPFRVGDYIQVGSNSGTVQEINILYTELLSSSRQFVTIPNKKFTSDAVTNFSRHTERRADIVVGIGYDDDIDKAKGILQDMINAEERIKSEPVSLVVVKELGDSSVNLLARFYTTPADYWSTVFDFNETVKKRFDTSGVSMPYPQRDVHLFKADTQDG